MKFALLVLSIVALASPTRAQSTTSTPVAGSAFTPAQKSEIEKMIHDYGINHPEVLAEWSEAYQKKAEADDQKNFKDNVSKYKDFLTDANTPFAGNPNGKHVIVEFFDYNCGWCKRSVDNVVALLKADPEAKIYFKDFPILAPSSTDASKWALASNKQGKYFDFYLALLRNNHPRDKQTYLEAAKVAGVDPVKLEQDAKDPSFDAIIAKNRGVANDLGIHGTPSFIFGSTLYPSFLTLPQMQHADATEFGGPGGLPSP